MEDFGLLVEDADDLLASDVVETDDSVRDSGGVEDFDPADLAGVFAVGSAAGFDVDSVNLDDS